MQPILIRRRNTYNLQFFLFHSVLNAKMFILIEFNANSFFGLSFERETPKEEHLT